MELYQSWILKLTDVIIQITNPCYPTSVLRGELKLKNKKNCNIMIELSPFNQNDFERFKAWIKSPDELVQFAGPIFTYPLTDNQLLSYINDSRRIAFKVIHSETQEVIGHCELNLENELPRLSRILVADRYARGKGLGKLIVHKMLEQLFVEHNFESADLNVFDWNKSAIRCYEQVGFTINPTIVKTQNNNGELWTALNMVISKEDWFKKKKT
jgi:RimJ/RimL family protein N-acetyltransferase